MNWSCPGNEFDLPHTDIKKNTTKTITECAIVISTVHCIMLHYYAQYELKKAQ